MIPFDYKLLLVRLLPEAMLVLGALVVLFLDQAKAAQWNDRKRSIVAIFCGLASVLAASLLILREGEIGDFYRGMVQFSPFVRTVKIGLLLLTAATLLVASPAQFTRHIGEYVALILLATIGLLFLAGTAELLTAFIALELTSLSLYLLAAFHKGSIRSAEGALKYFLFGSVAAAFTLFGISLVFGMAGSTTFSAIANSLRGEELSPLLIAGLVLTAIGFAFKMAAAPMHLWAPDVYQGAPVPSAALVASGSKLASFVLFMKFFLLAAPAQIGLAGWGKAVPGWAVMIAALAVTSMIVGNLLAIAQSNLRRLIAYSAIAHTGYVLLALLAASTAGAASAVYYLFTYGLAVIGVFGVIGLVEERHGELNLSDLAGLSRREPLLAVCLLLFALSLAGIPPLAGFFGKFYVFIAALESSPAGGVPPLLWLVIVAVLSSTVSLFYYLKILKQAFVSEVPSVSVVPSAWMQKLGIALLAGGVVLFGCFPNLLLQRLEVPGSNPPSEQNAPLREQEESSRKSAHLLARVR